MGGGKGGSGGGSKGGCGGSGGGSGNVGGGSTSKGGGGASGMMVAPGSGGAAIISRGAFESNPQGYFAGFRLGFFLNLRRPLRVFTLVPSPSSGEEESFSTLGLPRGILEGEPACYRLASFVSGTADRDE
ncbi:loricrin [Gossypium hirsutum]|uniref:Loricrin n=1 Tax=Gossypium hirsutum TaxID=3635 RepID=A0ABM3BBX2_GOSHI|nr:loricrin-like [Gossypium hirsutum]